MTREPGSVVKNEGPPTGAASFGWPALLQTKLSLPPRRSSLIARPRLVQALGSLQDARLVLIAAPAGFGKSTLAIEWLADQPRSSVAWLGLEPGDNDPNRFWRYVFAAIRLARPGFGEWLAQLAPDVALPPTDTVVAALLNELSIESALLNLVLDDYHVIQEPSIHQSVSYLLQHAPRTLRLVIVSRADPPLALARWQVQDELAEVRAADLRFTPDETNAYLNGMQALGLTADDLNALQQRTEGWPAGIHLVARSLASYSPAERSAFVRSFSGTHRYILNYLMEEVLQHQTPAVRDFLLHTCVLSRLAAPLCEAVTGRSDSQAILTQAAHDGLFISPLDNDGRWYHFHPLFSEALELQLRERQPALLAELHRRASGWCARNGHTELAVNHALASGSFDEAAVLIEKIAEKTWSHGDLPTLQRWLDALPPEVIAQRFPLRLYYIWALFLNDRWDEATAHWRESERLLNDTGSQESRHLRGMWAAIGGAMMAHRQEADETLRLTAEANELLSPENVTWRAIPMVNVGLAYLSSGRPEPAVQSFSHAADLTVAEGNEYLAFAALWHLSEALIAAGKLHQAGVVFDQVRQMEASPGGRALRLAANGDIGLGLLACERNDLLTAEALLAGGLGQIWPGGQPRVALQAQLGLARVLSAQRKRALAKQYLLSSLEMIRQYRLPALERPVQAYLAVLAADAGDWPAVDVWQNRLRQPSEEHLPVQVETEVWVRGQVAVRRGQFAEAADLLAPLASAAAADGRHGSRMAILPWLALALDGQGKTRAAEDTLREAVRFGEPEGYTRVFLDAGPDLIGLLSRPAVRQLAPRYVGHLLRSAVAEANSETSSTAPPGDGDFREPLTPRELDILVLIAAGASNQDIADRLYLSVGTVKGHVNHIFSKLDVHNRTAAVARARELGLLEA